MLFTELVGKTVATVMKIMNSEGFLVTLYQLHTFRSTKGVVRFDISYVLGDTGE